MANWNWNTNMSNAVNENTNRNNQFDFGFSSFGGGNGDRNRPAPGTYYQPDNQNYGNTIDPWAGSSQNNEGGDRNRSQPVRSSLRQYDNRNYGNGADQWVGSRQNVQVGDRNRSEPAPGTWRQYDNQSYSNGNDQRAVSGPNYQMNSRDSFGGYNNSNQQREDFPMAGNRSGQGNTGSQVNYKSLQGNGPNNDVQPFNSSFRRDNDFPMAGSSNRSSSDRNYSNSDQGTYNNSDKRNYDKAMGRNQGNREMESFNRPISGDRNYNNISERRNFGAGELQSFNRSHRSMSGNRNYNNTGRGERNRSDGEFQSLFKNLNRLVQVLGSPVGNRYQSQLLGNRYQRPYERMGERGWIRPNRGTARKPNQIGKQNVPKPVTPVTPATPVDYKKQIDDEIAQFGYRIPEKPFCKFVLRALSTGTELGEKTKNRLVKLSEEYESKMRPNETIPPVSLTTSNVLRILATCTTNPMDDKEEFEQLTRNYSINVLIVHKDYPNQRLTLAQKNLITAGIVNAIANVDDGTFPPRFLRPRSHRSGLMVICRNRYTYDWLRKIIPTIRPDGIQLRLIREKWARRSFKIMARIPCRIPIDYQKIINAMSLQNDRQRCGEWELIDESKVNDQQVYVWRINEASYRALRRREMLIHFGLGTIKMKRVGGRELEPEPDESKSNPESEIEIKD